MCFSLAEQSRASLFSDIRPCVHALTCSQLLSQTSLGGVVRDGGGGGIDDCCDDDDFEISVVVLCALHSMLENAEA